MKRQTYIILAITKLFFHWFLVCIFIIVSLVWPLANKANIVENVASKTFNAEQLKSFQKAIQWGWDSDRAFYFLEKHQFQRLFLQEWVRMYPQLLNNQLEFNYQTNHLGLPIAVKIFYKNPITKSVVQQWNFKIKKD